MGKTPFGIDNGLFYMRRSFAHEFEGIMYSGLVNLADPMCTMIGWQILIRKHANTFGLPEAYECPWWDSHMWADAYAIHFHGQGKAVRPYYDWKEWPKSWKRHDKPVEMDIEWI